MFPGAGSQLLDLKFRRREPIFRLCKLGSQSDEIGFHSVKRASYTFVVHAICRGPQGVNITSRIFKRLIEVFTSFLKILDFLLLVLQFHLKLKHVTLKRPQISLNGKIILGRADKGKEKKT